MSPEQDILGVFRAQVLMAQVSNLAADEHIFATVRIPGLQNFSFRTPVIPNNDLQWKPGSSTFDFPITRSWISSIDSSSLVAELDGTNGSYKASQDKNARANRAKFFPHKASRYLRSSAVAGVNVVRKHRPRPILLRRRFQRDSNERDENPVKLALPVHAAPGSLELVLWSVPNINSPQQTSYLAEISIPVSEWVCSKTGDISWDNAVPKWQVLEPESNHAALQLRLGFLPGTVKCLNYKLFLNEVYCAVCKAADDDEIMSLRNIPATQAVGMSEDHEDLRDDGLTNSESEYDSETALGPEVYDRIEEVNLTAASDSCSESSLSELEEKFDSAVAIDQDNRSNPVGMRRKLLAIPSRSNWRRAHRRGASITNDLGQSDADDSDAPRRYWQLRKFRLRSLPSLKNASLNGGQEELERRTRKKLRRPRARKLERSGDFSFKAALGQDILGIMMIEVEGARDLPRWRNVTKTSFDMDPFAIVSFNRKIFRTRVCRHTLNPKWKEKLLFHVRSNEKGFNVKFFVYDWDKMSANDYVGEATLPVSNLMCAVPAPDPTTGLFDSDVATLSTMHTLELPLSRELGDEEQKYGTGKTPVLTIRFCYRPYEALRQRFWRELLQSYDTNDTNGVDIVEFSTMLSSLGSTLTRETINELYTRHGKNSETDELTFEEGVLVLEELLKRPVSARRKQVHVTASDSDSDGEEEIPVERIVRLRSCPLCNMPNLGQVDEMDILTHLALCASSDWHRVDEIAMSRFVTASQAHRKWYTNVIQKIGQGNYSVGANSANILVQKRDSGELLEEKMQVYVRLGIRLLYQGAYGQMSGARVRRMLYNMSIKQGRKFDAPSSTKFILPFITFHGINTDEMLVPVDAFTTFNEFFCRKIKMELRPVDDPGDPCTLVSCADCRLMAFPSVELATQLWIKGRQFSVQKLLGRRYGQETVPPFSVVIFRLAPQDYHRFHVPVDGIIGEPDWVDGEYYTVNPMGIRSTIDVFGENKRVIIPIHTQEFGNLYIIAIGAMMVGSIRLSVQPSQRVCRGEELGYFKFGGSTLVLLAEKDRLQIDQDLLHTSDSCIETLVRVGMHIGRACDVQADTKVPSST